MPFRSQKQSALFRLAASRPEGAGGISQETATQYIKDSKHQKVGKLLRYAKLKALMGKKDE